MSNKHSIIICLFLSSFSAFSQIFERIEEVSGLNQLSNTMGIAVADYDKDQDLDLFVVAKKDFSPDNPSTWSRLYSNNNDGTFTDVTIQAGFQNLYNFEEADPGWEYGVKLGASWGDYDNDGYADLFLSNYHRIQLFHNGGDGTFEEVTEAAGFPTIDSCYNTSALWWDFNKDGWLDMYVSRWGGCSQNRYYQNNGVSEESGQITFTDKTDEFNIGSRYERTWMSIPIDPNQDGLWDLYLANDFVPNELFIQNSENSFYSRAHIYGSDFRGNEMGMTIGDYNNDGVYDIYVTNIAENRLFSFSENNRNPDLAYEKNVLNTYWGWATQFSDFDLDGDEDLFVSNGYQNDQFHFPVFKYNFLFKNLHIEGQDTFQDWSAENQVNERSNSMGLCVFDFDKDGDQDILVSNMDAPPFFYENKTINEDTINELNWVSFQLEGTTSNRDGLGSQLKVWTKDQVQQRLYYGANLFAQNLQGVHFGLGTATVIDSLEIIWDAGHREKFYTLPTNQHYFLKEQVCLSVLDPNAQEVAGCDELVAIDAVLKKEPTVIFPNPSNGDTHITILNTHASMPLKIVDIQGKELPITTIKFDAALHTTTFQLANLPTGIYFIVTIEGTWKLVII